MIAGLTGAIMYPGGATMVPSSGVATEPVLIGLLVAFDGPLDVAVSAMIVTRLTCRRWAPPGIGFVVLPIAINSERAAGPA